MATTPHSCPLVNVVKEAPIIDLTVVDLDRLQDKSALSVDDVVLVEHGEELALICAKSRCCTIFFTIALPVWANSLLCIRST